MSKHSTPIRSFVAVTALLALFAVACGDDSSSGSSGEDLSISVTSPADGATVGEEFEVDVDTSVPIGETDTGRHHVHLYYDGERAEGEYDIVYDVPFTVTRQLSPGEHTVDAVIANADHSTTDANQEFTVTVEPGGGGSGGGGTGGGGEDEPTTSVPDTSGIPGY